VLRGEFDAQTGRPSLKGRLFLPRLRLSERIAWLVDTGADSSLLNPSAAFLLGIDFLQLRGSAESRGVGGRAETYLEQAMLVFDEPLVGFHIYVRDLAVSMPDPDLDGLPSLLGRDILDNWAMSYNPSERELTFRVITAEATISRRPS
jgi:hypothetical protein